MPLCEKITKSGRSCKNYRVGNFEFCATHSSDCVICFEKLVSENVQELACGHMFHHNCIERWLEDNSTCPCCRKLADHHITLHDSIKCEDITHDFMAELVRGMIMLPKDPMSLFVKMREDTGLPYFTMVY